MTDPCERLHAYVDDELPDAERAAFEAHLASCQTCMAELPRLLGLAAALDGIAGHRAASPRLAVLNGGLDAPRPAAPLGSTRGRERILRMAAGLVAIAGLAAGGLIMVRPSAKPPLVAAPDELALPRVLEARLSYPGADRYGPLDSKRGAVSEATASDRMVERQLLFERARNWHGLAVASLAAGDRERAARAFARAPATPEVDSDHATLGLLDGSSAALERALELVDRAIAASPRLAAARWNRALVLAAMGLPLAAAKELDEVAALDEPGWATEAKARADALRRQVAQRRTHWRQALDARRRLIEDGTPIPTELFDLSGIMTLTLYDAVRSAPSRDRVLALRPLARSLDLVYRNTRLTAYVERIAASDFRARKPLADRYRELALGRITPADSDGFLRQLARAGTAADDLRLGALVLASRVAERLDEYQRLAAASGDPWFTVIADQEAATAEAARGNMAAAEYRLQDALALTRRERLVYRALRVASHLIDLQERRLELSPAMSEAQTAYREATTAGEWVFEMGFLADLAAIQQNRYATGLARAYLTELAERGEAGLGTGDDVHAAMGCERQLYAHASLAHLAILQRDPDPDRARMELSRAPRCHRDPISNTMAGSLLRMALIRAELYRVGRREEDARLARESLSLVRDLPAAELPGKDAFLAYIEGTLLLQDDPAAGKRALREAIAKAGDDRHDHSIKARTQSLLLLALEAGRASAFDDVITVMAEALHVRKPERCAVAIAADHERHAVAFVDALGGSGGQYVVRGPGALDSAKLVPPAAIARLRDCQHIAVLTRAPVLGLGRLLPPELAWSYRLTDQAPAAVRGSENATHRLVIANPERPPDVDLPDLSPFTEEAGAPAVTILRGPDATPSRVLLAMQDASVIEFHTHGVLADDVFEASHLILSPEQDRRYKLTAGDVGRIRLAASPLVILGACHAATSSRVLEGGMGLAESFLHAGARAVLASPDAVQDRGANAFFSAVRERVLRGEDPAVALRDERMQRLSATHDDAWISGVVVFE